MYTPQHNLEENAAKLFRFIREHGFATLVTSVNDSLRATHLPFMAEKKDGDLRLFAHMARANPQWRDFSPEREALVIFQEPHAYVSPRHYDSAQSVPTWNYVAVHAYGHAKVLEESAEKLSLLEKLIGAHDEGYFERWRELPESYINTKLQGIVAFRVDVARLEARFKLSQDRTETERERIIAEFEGSGDTLLCELGGLMRESMDS